MNSPSAMGTRSHLAAGRRRLRRAVAVAVILGLVVPAAVVLWLLVPGLGTDAAAARSASPAARPASPAAEPTPAPTPLTAAEKLLASTDDPRACVVSFRGDGIEVPPMLQSEGALYAGLPVPRADGRVFAGWYADPAAAAAYSIPSRVNGSELVSCADREVTLHGSWKSPEENAAEDAHVPILMYHQFTSRPEGETGWLRGNYAYIGDFDAHLNHIATTGFYLPTWDELSAFIDGALFLPDRSVIVTDDDADQSWFDLAAPVVEKYAVMTTSFMITAYRQDPAPSPYVLRRSHTHDMHQAGANGEGRIVNWPIPDIVADMEASGQALGVKEVMAYPFGHHNDVAKEALRQAGWEMARTIAPGYVVVGTDKLALPAVRINYGMGVDDLIALIG